MTKSLSLFAILVASILSLSLATPATAAPVIDQNQTVNLEGISGPSCTNMAGVYNMGVGSAFTAGVSGVLTSIDVPIAGTATPSGVTMNVWNVDGVTGLPTGDSIASQEISVATVSSLASGGNLSVVFDTPATVVAENKYAFTLDFPADCVGQSYSMWMNVGAAPSDKRRVANVSGHFYVHPWVGLGFTTFVEVPTTEPGLNGETDSLAQTGSNFSAELGSFALGALLLGAVLMLYKRRARN